MVLNGEVLMIRRDDDDDDGRKRVLRDGERLRVPLWMMDGTQLEIAQRWGQSETAESKAVVTDALGQSGLALHRPGARYLASNSTTGIAVQATLRSMRDEYDAEQSHRWEDSDREIPLQRITGDARWDAYLAREQHDTNAWRGAGR
jgi:hypothetical protein